MNVGIILFSKTGNTEYFGLKLKERLESINKRVTLKKIELTKDSKLESGMFEFEKRPKIKSFDIVIFGSPVHGFSLSIVMVKYIEELCLSGKKVICFVTQHFPYAWMGGNRAIKQMKNLCNEKGATIIESGIINWSRKNREENIEKTVNLFLDAIEKK